jgi:hypothetical protein
MSGINLINSGNNKAPPGSIKTVNAGMALQISNS